MTSVLTAKQAAALILQMNGGHINRETLRPEQLKTGNALKARRERLERARTLRAIENGTYEFKPSRACVITKIPHRQYLSGSAAVVRAKD